MTTKDPYAEIILLEDSKADANLLIHALDIQGLEASIEVMGYGRQLLAALESRRQNLPRLIIMDLYLPDFYGPELLEKLRGHSHFKHIPVVVRTGSQNQKDEANSRRLGVLAYLVKPVEFEALLEEASYLVGLWRLIQHNNRKRPRALLAL